MALSAGALRVAAGLSGERADWSRVHARCFRREANTFWLSRLRKGPGMRHHDSILASLLKPISRRQSEVNPSKPMPKTLTDQLEMRYA